MLLSLLTVNTAYTVDSSTLTVDRTHQLLASTLKNYEKPKKQNVNPIRFLVDALSKI